MLDKTKNYKIDVIRTYTAEEIKLQEELFKQGVQVAHGRKRDSIISIQILLFIRQWRHNSF